MYKHILVAVDLSEESKVLVEKGAAFARACGAKLSLIHVSVSYTDLYTGLIDINMFSLQDAAIEEARQALSDLAAQTDYPVELKLNGSGDFGHVLSESVRQYEVDLVITGHHQDFWSKFISSAKQLMGSMPIDLLIVPLQKADA